MKTDEIRFTTTKSMPEIVNILRSAASRYRADLTKLDDDPFGSIGGQAPDVAVGMSAPVRVLGMSGARSWGVQIYVTELGNARAVELIALGDGMAQKFSGAAFFDIGIGRSKRDEIARMLSDSKQNTQNKQNMQQTESGQETNRNTQQTEPVQASNQNTAVYSAGATNNSNGNHKTILIIAGVIIAALLIVIPLSNSSSSNYGGDEEQYSEDEYYEEEAGTDSVDVEEESSDGYFVTGNTYYVQTNLRVREGPGKEYRILSRDELTPEDYAISVDSTTTTDALIEEGKMLTCQGMSDNWMKISSGWICVYDEGEELVK